jgi:hypothetical protein
VPPRQRIQNPDQVPWEGAHVYRIVRGLRPPGRRYALIQGWPTPVSELARTLMPPLPGRPSYCREARKWAQAMLQANKAHNMTKKPKAERKWLGPITLRWLRAVHRGEKPLKFCEYDSLRRYWAPTPPREPAKLAIQLGGGLRVGYAARSESGVLAGR